MTKYTKDTIEFAMQNNISTRKLDYRKFIDFLLFYCCYIYFLAQLSKYVLKCVPMCANSIWANQTKIFEDFAEICVKENLHRFSICVAVCI